MKRYWTKIEESDLRNLYQSIDTKELAIYFNRPESSIYYKAYELGLKKNKEYFIALAKKNNLKETGAKYRFKTAQKPWNDGIKYSVISNKTRSTQFKPGDLPWNTKTTGTISIRTDKRGNSYQFIKVEGERLFVMLHRHIWVKANGPIPEGKIIRFIDGNTMNCVLENLELIDRKKHMKKNTFLNLPEDLRKVLQAKRILTRIINQKTKKL
jgi:hypothetical protein